MPTFSPRYRAWLLTVLVGAYTCSFIDRIVISVIGPAIIRDLQLTDLQFGLLGGLAFALFYSTFGVPIARLAERRSRINIISISIALWSAMTMACGFAQTYLQLLLCRVGVGVGEAGCSPPAHSLISDHFPPRRRATALSIYSIGVPLGATIGAVAGGWLAQTFNWRVAFLVVGAPGLVLAAVAKLTLREPPRGFAEGEVVADTPGLLQVVRRLSGSRTFVHVCLGASLTTLAANGINLFGPTYFVRAFGLGMADVGLMYGLVMGVAGALGILIGGMASDRAGGRDLRWYGWLPAAGALIAAPCYAAAYSLEALVPAMVFVFAGGLAMSIYFAPSFAVAQNLVEPRMRASAAALLFLTINLLGQGLGPLVMGFVSDRAAAASFDRGSYEQLCRGLIPAPEIAPACAQASVVGLRFAIVTMTVFFLWGAVHYVLASRSMTKDLKRA